MARLLPAQAAICCAMTRAEPESSMTLPNSAPSMNSGKNFPRYLPSSAMNICVYVPSSSGVVPPLKSTAINAMIGASSRTLMPRYARYINSPRDRQIPKMEIAVIVSPLELIGESGLADGCPQVDGSPSQEFVRGQGGHASSELFCDARCSRGQLN